MLCALERMHRCLILVLDSLLTFPLLFVSFANRHLANPRYTEQLTGVTMSVLDIYGGVVSSSPKAIGLLTKLQAQVKTICILPRS